MGRPAQEPSTAGNCRKSPSSRNFTSAFSPTQARSAQSACPACDLLHRQPVQLLRAAPAHVPAHPVVGRLRPQAQVLRGHQVHRLALLSQPHHNRPGQVRLSGARQAREQQGVPRQAVAYRVIHPVPPPLFGALRLHARRPAAAQQRPRLFYRRAVRVAQRLQRPQPLREALRQPLRQQAVRLHLRKVAGRRVQDAPGLGHHVVLKAQDRHGWGGRCRCSAAFWRRRSPTHAPLVGEGLREVRARAVQLAAAAAHAVDHLRAARPQAYHRVHAELGHVLLALGPGGVHALQRAPQRRRVHVSARRYPTQCGPSGRRPGPASRPAKPSGTSRAPRTATD